MRVIFVCVRVIFFSKLIICLFYVFLVCIFGDPKYGIIILQQLISYVEES